MICRHEFIKPKPIVQRNNMRVDEEASRKYDYKGSVSVASLSLQRKGRALTNTVCRNQLRPNLAQSFHIATVIVGQNVALA